MAVTRVVASSADPEAGLLQHDVEGLHANGELVGGHQSDGSGVEIRQVRLILSISLNRVHAVSRAITL